MGTVISGRGVGAGVRRVGAGVGCPGPYVGACVVGSESALSHQPCPWAGAGKDDKKRNEAAVTANARPTMGRRA